MQGRLTDSQLKDLFESLAKWAEARNLRPVDLYDLCRTTVEIIDAAVDKKVAERIASRTPEHPPKR